jgi:hypothetical protein
VEVSLEPLASDHSDAKRRRPLGSQMADTPFKPSTFCQATMDIDAQKDAKIYCALVVIDEADMHYDPFRRQDSSL